MPSDFSALLARSACRGSCPVYSLKVSANGSVHYNGMRHVLAEGHFQTSISTEEVAELYRVVVENDFFDLKDSYNTEGVLDLPTVTVTITLNGQRKSIDSLGIGCESFSYRGFDPPFEPPPDALCDVEALLDRILTSNGWI